MQYSFRWILCVVFSCLWIDAACAAGPPWDAQPAASPDASVTAEPPSIEIPESTYDFGEIQEGTEIKHAFTVKNSGGGPLEINQVRPG